MLRCSVYLCNFFLLLVACDATQHDRGDAAATAARPDAGGATQAESDAGEQQQAPDDGGTTQTSAMQITADSEMIAQVPTSGMPATCDEMRCAGVADELASTFMMPAAWSRTFEGGKCDIVGVLGSAEGLGCVCDTGDGGSTFIGPEGAGCFAFGRAGDCLWSDADYEPCSTETDPCPAMCEELEARYAADAAKTFDVEVRYSVCAQEGADSICHSVLRIEDTCFADRSYLDGRGFDCKLSDQDIIERDAKARKREMPPRCSELPDEGGECWDVVPPQECVARPASEWQGLRVCAPYPPCETSDRCGIALACIDELCQACTKDEQCAPGEGCALDHCMPMSNISCRVAADCQDGELCILSGYTGSARANEDMRAYCVNPSGGAKQMR